MVDASEVTLSDRSQSLCVDFAVQQDDLRAARAEAWSLYERHGWLACRGRLPAADREAIMFCPSSRRTHVETFRLAN